MRPLRGPIQRSDTPCVARRQTSFYRALAEGDMTEVDLARLAEQKSENPKVKDFAAMGAGLFRCA